MEIKKILTIAGSDSGGGAGIQADLKTITLLGGYGLSVVTALTAQNTCGVSAIQQLPQSFISAQIDSVLSDIGADAIKTGMLARSEIIEIVAKKIKQYGIKKVIVDPVMFSKNGDPLLSEDGRVTLIKKLFPLATIVTPNLLEASILTDLKIKEIDDMKEASKKIYRFGPQAVLIKGGHLKGDLAIDLLYDGKGFHEFCAKRIDSKNTHGTGCTFASAIATYLAMGETLNEAIRKSKDFITLAIKYGLNIGKGNGPLNQFAFILKEIKRFRVIEELKQAIEILKKERIGHLIPEVSSNLGYALPYANGPEDIASFPGRIVRFKDTIKTLADPEFGVSSHIANIILSVIRFDPDYCSAMNIRYSKENILKLKKKGFTIGHFDRKKEPKELKEKEGSSLEWGVSMVLEKMKRVPDFIYDEGDIGKEPMIRVLGRNPIEVVNKVKALI